MELHRRLTLQRLLHPRQQLLTLLYHQTLQRHQRRMHPRHQLLTHLYHQTLQRHQRLLHPRHQLLTQPHHSRQLYRRRQLLASSSSIPASSSEARQPASQLRIQLPLQRRGPCCRELRPPGLSHGALRRKRRVVAVVCDGGVEHRGVRERLREQLHLGDGQAVQLDGVGLREVRGVGGGCRTLFSFW